MLKSIPNPLTPAKLTALRQRHLPLGASAEVAGQYLHWDELRHRTPPGQLTATDWWHLVEATREPLRRALPLLDTGEVAFQLAIPDSAQRELHLIDRDLSGRIELPEDVINPATRDRYIVNSLVEEAITSSQLEGAATTRKVAKEMLRTGRTPRTPDERMIANNFRAMEWIREHTTDTLTPALVLQLHRIVTDGTFADPSLAGRLRKASPEEDIGVYDADGELVHKPPAAATLAARMDLMCQFGRAELDTGFVHPVVRAILLHFWLAYDHPFVDGNGRTARALFYWAALKEGYWLTQYISISRLLRKAPSQYSRAFVHVESTRDVTYFLMHQLATIRRATDDLGGYLRRKAREVRETEAALRDTGDLNHRQLLLVSRALKHPLDDFTIAGHRKSHGIAYDTARRDLLELVARGWFTQLKRSKQLVFRPADDLPRRARR